MIAITARVPSSLRRAAILCALTITPAIVPLAGRQENPAKPGGPAAVNLFDSSCATCHAVDGSGTKLGKDLETPDLRSRKVQEQPDSAWSQVIREGKNNMP